MAWNRPSSDNSVQGSQRRDRSRDPILWGVVAAAVLLAVAAAVWWLSSSNVDHKVANTTLQKHEHIREANHSSPPTNIIVQVAPKVPYWELENTNGFTEAMQRKWRNVRRPRKEPIKPHVKKAKYAIFDYRSENLIASVLAAKPGASMIGRPNYRGINEDFLKSCTAPILVGKDDDEYTRNLKKVMIETKIELKERIEAGEDLGKIIEDSRAELRNLAQTKRMIEKEVRDYIKSDATPEDLDLFIQSANKLLEKKGLAPLRIGPITKYKLMRLNKED